jgi:O-acetyl-ADP-ribose deacetylase (regulator of RNase III)
MKEINGDLVQMALDGEFDVIAHGCNCFNTMCSGIAKQIADKIPGAEEVDAKTPKGSENKLGFMTIYSPPTGTSVCNLYTQYNYTKDQVDVDYDALRNALRRLGLSFNGQKIGLPKIGAGRAGGDWEKIKQIINEELTGQDVTIVHFDGNDDYYSSGRRTR